MIQLGTLRFVFQWLFQFVQINDAHLYRFAANLFRKLCTKFHQNRPSFVEDITKTVWSFFSGHTVYITEHVLLPDIKWTGKTSINYSKLFWGSSFYPYTCGLSFDLLLTCRAVAANHKRVILLRH